jgi:hypothetical protein
MHGVFLVGGCLWQRQNPSHLPAVLSGLQQWREVKPDSEPVTLLMMSAMDATVRLEGAYSKTQKNNPRIDYGSLPAQLRGFVQHECYLTLASHGDVTRFALAAVNHYLEHDVWSEKERHCRFQEIDHALLAMGALPGAAVEIARQTEVDPRFFFQAPQLKPLVIQLLQ